MSQAELVGKSDIAQEAQRIWLDWAGKAQELIEQLPLLLDEENEWIVPRIKDILRNQSSQYGNTQPARPDPDINHLRLARAIFSVLRNQNFEDIPRGMTYQRTKGGVVFHIPREVEFNAIQPKGLVFFIENYGLTGEEVNKSNVHRKYGVSMDTTRKGIMEARRVILNHTAVKPLWAQVPQKYPID